MTVQEKIRLSAWTLFGAVALFVAGCAAEVVPTSTDIEVDPEQLQINPCAVTLCPTGTTCVVHASHAECAPGDKCALVRCAAGTHCEAGSCIPDEPQQLCGGIAGFPCPGAGKCVDDPSDDCDPKQGGADCGGMCLCPRAGICPIGSRWDPSPNVCSCVPAATCGGNACGAGQYCCNPSCGICAPLGAACIQIACNATL